MQAFIHSHFPADAQEVLLEILRGDGDIHESIHGFLALPDKALSRLLCVSQEQVRETRSLLERLLEIPTSRKRGAEDTSPELAEKISRCQQEIRECWVRITQAQESKEANDLRIANLGDELEALRVKKLTRRVPAVDNFYERELVRLQQEIATLEARNVSEFARIPELRARIAELEGEERFLRSGLQMLREAFDQRFQSEMGVSIEELGGRAPVTPDGRRVTHTMAILYCLLLTWAVNADWSDIDSNVDFCRRISGVSISHIKREINNIPIVFVTSPNHFLVAIAGGEYGTPDALPRGIFSVESVTRRISELALDQFRASGKQKIIFTGFGYSGALAARCVSTISPTMGDASSVVFGAPSLSTRGTVPADRVLNVTIRGDKMPEALNWASNSLRLLANELLRASGVEGMDITPFEPLPATEFTVDEAGVRGPQTGKVDIRQHTIKAYLRAILDSEFPEGTGNTPTVGQPEPSEFTTLANNLPRAKSPGTASLALEVLQLCMCAPQVAVLQGPKLKEEIMNEFAKMLLKRTDMDRFSLPRIEPGPGGDALEQEQLRARNLLGVKPLRTWMYAAPLTGLVNVSGMAAKSYVIPTDADFQRGLLTTNSIRGFPGTIRIYGTREVMVGGAKRTEILIDATSDIPNERGVTQVIGRPTVFPGGQHDLDRFAHRLSSAYGCCLVGGSIVRTRSAGFTVPLCSALSVIRLESRWPYVTGELPCRPPSQAMTEALFQIRTVIENEPENLQRCVTYYKTALASEL